MKGGYDNENGKNYSETEGCGSGLPYGKRRGSQAVARSTMDIASVLSILCQKD